MQNSKNDIRRQYLKQELNREYENIIIAIRGYIKDSKKYGFEPTDLQGMKDKAYKLSRQINSL